MILAEFYIIINLGGDKMALGVDKLKKAIAEVKKDLGEGLVATDIWATADTKSLIYSYAGSDMYAYGMTPLSSLSKKKQSGNSISSYSGQPKVISLFNEVTRKLDKTLTSADYPGLGNYYLINLENNHLALVLGTGAYQLLFLVDLSKTTMGILMSVALPKLLQSYQ